MKATHALLTALLIAGPARAAGGEFVRCDQASKQRAPYNVADFTYVISKGFAAPAEDAKKVIQHLSHTKTPFPVYLGKVEARRFAAEPALRAHVTQLAKLVTEAAKVRCLVYLHEDAPQHAVPAALAGDLQELAKHATLAMATSCDGLMTREQVQARVRHVHEHYGGTLKIPLSRMLVDVDLSQTAEAQHFGTRGHQKNFDEVVGWALDETFALRFGGFHTMGNARNQNGAKRAADSTYVALNEAWGKLVAAHPEQAFPGHKAVKAKSGPQPKKVESPSQPSNR
jgi:hypothetical protein